MVNLFFVTFDFSGVRTYANELFDYLSNKEEIVLHKIYLESTYYNEYTEIVKNTVTYIHIPEVKQKERSLKKYSARCINLIEPVVAGKRNIIFHLNYSTQVKFGLEARKKFGAKLVYTMHYLPNFFSYLAIDGVFRENLGILGENHENEMIREADQIICISKFAQHIIIKHYNTPKNKTKVIYNGYGVVKKKPPKEIARIKGNFGFGENELLILFVGRLGVEKGVHALIRVFKKISKNFHDTRLVLAGEGNFTEIMQLCHDIAGKVTFTGKLTKEQLLKLYSIADIGVVPSHFELLGYIPIEMMYNRIPVVISNVPGMNELVEDGKNGLICKVNKRTDGLFGLRVDEESLYLKLKSLLKDKAFAEQLAQNGRLCWEDSFTAEHMGKATLKLYKQLQLKPINNDIFNYLSTIEERRAGSMAICSTTASCPPPSSKQSLPAGMERRLYGKDSDLT
ncbi:MAG: glycosyltransferase [Cytophagales bacterium]|nr:glycosyltransferase [Cytophagales bacterium]